VVLSDLSRAEDTLMSCSKSDRPRCCVLKSDLFWDRVAEAFGDLISSSVWPYLATKHAITNTETTRQTSNSLDSATEFLRRALGVTMDN